MVKEYTCNDEKIVESVVAELSSDDIEIFAFTKEQSKDARIWIEKQGYHLRNTSISSESPYTPYAHIRLEKSRYTIISVITDCPTGGCIKDCICYAAVLLYRRLKRNGAIA